MNPESRSCTKCGETKPLTDFSKAPRGKYGRKSRCKECDAARHAAIHPPKPRVYTKLRPAFTGAEPKTCRKCGETKPLSEFSLSRRETPTRNAVYRSDCKTCSSAAAMAWFKAHPERTSANKRRYNLESYGLTPACYDALLAKQGGACAICARPPIGKRLHVDHNHSTGMVRALLCRRCNSLVGFIEKHDVAVFHRPVEAVEEAYPVADIVF